MLFGTTPAAARPINTYSWWTYTAIALIAVLAIIYSLPNFYPTDPVLQLSGQKGASVSSAQMDVLKKAFEDAKISYKAIEQNESTWLVRFHDTDEQLRAQMEARKALGDSATVALNLMPSTPAWLKSLGADPMKLGLDLSGGIHFLIEIDMKTALSKKEQGMVDLFKTELRQEKIQYAGAQRGTEGGIVVKFRDEASRAAGQKFLQSRYADLLFTDSSDGEFFLLTGKLTEAALKVARDEAVEQNLTILRNRVNELGVAEPLIQRQGADRIVVQLPGIQDSALAKRLLSATASLEFRAGNENVDPLSAEQGRVPADSEAMQYKGRWVALKKHAFVTGDELTGASSGVDENGLPSVNVRLDGKGGQKMLAHTKQNVGKPMAGVIIEYKTKYADVDGKQVAVGQTIEKRLATYATINGVFSSSFQITGLDSPAEARELAMTLRSGALTAPIMIVEERTVGPSMGKENIEKGITAMGFAMLAVMGFMLLKYRIFGIATNIALFTNLALTMAIMSMFGAVLTMPGIAGLVLGLAMSVDANVLINERIREEIRGGKTPQMAIKNGYEEASGAILDSNITILISGVVLYGIGSGSIKGFAVTMIIGNLASMFTAVAGTRAIVNAIHGGRDLKKLWI